MVTKYILALEILQDPYLEKLRSPTFFDILFHGLLILVNPVKSCMTSGQFFPAGIDCLGLDAFHSFFYNNHASSVV